MMIEIVAAQPSLSNAGARYNHQVGQQFKVRGISSRVPGATGGGIS